jgi:hypothetical protein
VLLVSAAVGGTAAAQTVSAQSPSPAPVRSLPLPASVPVTTCPGPQTLLAPPGAKPVQPPGPVVVSAVATGPATLGVLVPPAPGRSSTADSAAAVRLLTRSRTTAGGVRLDVARSVPGVPAPASSAVQATLGLDGDLRGLVATGCAAAVSDAWLVGGGTTEGERSRLVLSNPTPSPALLDVLVHGPDGVVKAPAGEGIVVPAGGQQVLFVDALAPDLGQAAVRVTARNGRVVASMQHSRLLGFTPGGVDDVTASAEPATTQVVPGIVVRAPGRAAVRVVVPGAEEAVVRVALLGVGATAQPATPIAPVVVSVPGGAVRDVPLTVGDGLYVAVVSSDVPLVAGALSTTTLAGGELAGTPQALGSTVPPTDLAWAPSVSPLNGAVAIAVPQFVGSDVKVSASLVLAAPSGAAVARLRPVTAAARIGPARSVDLDEAGVEVVDLAAGTAAVLLDLVAGQSSRGGPGGSNTSGLVAALVLRADDAKGPLLATVPLRPGPAQASTGPEVVEDPMLGVGPS